MSWKCLIPVIFLPLLLLHFYYFSLIDLHRINLIKISNETILPYNSTNQKNVSENYACYHRAKSELQNNSLEDLSESNKQPNNRTIFFVLTTCFKDGLIQINKR